MDPQSYDGTDSTQQEFDEFMGSSICIRLMISSQAAATNPAAPNVTVSTVQAELQAFRKGIKRDAGLYPVMTQDTQWDTWNRSVVSVEKNVSGVTSEVSPVNGIPTLPESRDDDSARQSSTPWIKVD
jgi:hypothetical protein